MKKELLNEINNIRIKMGLKVLNEGSMLITETGTVSALLSKVLPKSVIGATEKALILKFLQKGLTEIEKESLSNFFKSAEGKAFVTELRNEIANESDDALRMRLDAWLTTTERSFTKPKGAKKTKTGQGSNNLMPNPDPTYIPNPTEIAQANIEDIIKQNMKNPRFKEYMVMLDNLNLTDEVKDLMVISYSKVGNDAVRAIEYANTLAKSLDEKKYGWLKTAISKAMKNPAKTISIGGKTIAVGTFWYVTVVAALALGGAAIGWVNYAKSILPKAPENKLSDEELSDEELAKKDGFE